MKLLPLPILFALVLLAGCNLEVIPDDLTPPTTDCPAANFTYTTSGCTTLPCTVQFNNQSSNRDGATYNWKVDGVSFSTAESPSRSFAADGSYQVTLEVSKTDCVRTDTTIMVVVNTSGGNPNITPFIKTFDFGATDISAVIGVGETADGKISVIGSDWDRFYVFKADPTTGEPITPIGSYNGLGFPITPASVTKTNDGYVVAGSINFQNADNQGVLLKVNSDLSVTGPSMLKDENNKQEFGYGVCQTGDGGYLLCGQATNNTGTDSAGLFLVKTNGTLAKSWHAYPFPNDPSSAGLRIVATTSGYAVGARRINPSTSQYEACFFQMSKSMVVNEASLKYLGVDAINDIINLDNQNFIIITQGGKIFKINTTGTQIWNPAISIQAALNKAAVVTGNKLAVVGSTNTGSTLEATLLFIDLSTGNIVGDQKFYSPDLASGSEALYVTAAADGGLLIGGAAYFGLNIKPMLIKTDADGNSQ